MAVDRGVVEVGTELRHGILRVLRHERLAAEADDRRLGGAVAVVLPALAVQADEALVVLGGPEDVVREEAVSVIGGLLGDLGGADRAVPDEGCNTVEGPRGRREALQGRAELALPVDDVFAPQLVQQRVVLDREGQALADVFAEPGVDGTGVAAAHHEVHAPAGEVLQHGVVFGDLDRVVGRDEGRRGRDDEALGLRGDVGERRRGRRRPERRVVVLAEREDVEADLFGVLRDLDRRPNALGFARGVARDGVLRDVADRHDAELHLLRRCGGVLAHDDPDFPDASASNTCK